MSLSSINPASQAGPVAKAAAQWALRREQGELSPTEQRELGAWLARDSAHAAAYSDAVWALDAIARHAAEPELMVMREGALAARGERRSRGWIWGGLGGAVAASLLGMGLWTGSLDGLVSQRPVHTALQAADPNHADYVTAVGERLTVTLPDNSVVTLDTDSRIRVAYSSFERGVQLLRGQALFEVAHGKALPFRVYATGQRITAVGTLFNVRLKGNQVKVALLQGAIRVRPAPRSSASRPSNAPEFVMRAGEVAELRPADPAVVRVANVSQLASWHNGDLVFNDTRLADAVSEINRYTNHPIRIADSYVGNYRITGVFRSNDPEHFCQAMSEILPVDVARSSDGAPFLRGRK